jgi:hypothetical protein
MKAQHRDPKQLVMCGQDGAGQIVEAVLALLAPVALPVSLRVIMAVASYRHCLIAGSGQPQATNDGAPAHSNPRRQSATRGSPGMTRT